MRLNRKIMTIMVAVLLFTTSSGFTAVQSESDDFSTIVQTFLAAAYKMGAVDSTEFTVYEPIPTYELLENELVLSEIEMYPVVNGRELIAFICKDGDSFTLSSALATEISDVLNFDETSICMIYDRLGVYIWAQNNLIMLHEYRDSMEFAYRDIMSSDVEEEIAILCNEITKVMFEIALPTVQACSDDTMYCYIDVPLVQQKTDYWCWAACMSCVMQKVANKSVSQEELADYYGLDSTGMITQAEMRSGFHAYGLTQISGAGASNAERMFSSLCNGYPSVGCFMPTSGDAGHYVVIRAIDYEANVFSFMDPYYGTYKVGSITSSGYTFSSEFYNQTYQLSGFLYIES